MHVTPEPIQPKIIVQSHTGTSIFQAFSKHFMHETRVRTSTYNKKTRNLASFTFLDASKRNRSATKGHHSSKNESSELKQKYQGQNEGVRLNPNQTHIPKQCKRGKDQETLRFNLLGSRSNLASSKWEVHCTLAELLLEKRKGNRKLVFENEAEWRGLGARKGYWVPLLGWP